MATIKAIAYSSNKNWDSSKLEDPIRIITPGSGISYPAINSAGYIAIIEIEEKDIGKKYVKAEIVGDTYLDVTDNSNIKYVNNPKCIKDIPIKELIDIVESVDLRNGGEGAIIYGALHEKIDIMSSIIGGDEYKKIIDWLKNRIEKCTDDECIYCIGVVLKKVEDMSKYVHKIKSDKYKYFIIRDWGLNHITKEKIADTIVEEKWLYNIFELRILKDRKIKNIIKNKIRKDGLVLAIINKYVKFTRRELEQLGRELNTEDPWSKLEEIRIMLNAWKRST